jgi:hypothetical protein
MPRNPSFQNLGVNNDSLLECTMYFDYSSDRKQTKFEARVRMTIGQLVRFGGMNKLQRRMDDMLYDLLGIQSEDFDKTTIGFCVVEEQPTRYGSWKLHDVHTGRVYPKGDPWGSMEYVWR